MTYYEQLVDLFRENVFGISTKFFGLLKMNNIVQFYLMLFDSFLVRIEDYFIASEKK